MTRLRLAVVAALAGLGLVRPALAQDDAPTLRAIMDVPVLGGMAISPDGRWVAYVERAPNWDADDWSTRLFVSDGGMPAAIPQAEGISGSFHWTPDSEWLAYLAPADSGAVLRLVRAAVPHEVVSWPVPEGTRGFEISPAGDRIALAIEEPETREQLRERDLFGSFEVKGRGFRLTHLWVAELDLPDGAPRRALGPGATRRLTSGEFTVDAFAWSPDGSRIAFDHAPDPRPNSSYASDISIVDVDTGILDPLVTDPGRDAGPLWSPDGREILYSSSQGIPVSNLPLELVAIPATGGEGRLLTGGWATEPDPVAWIGEEVWFVADDGMPRGLYHLNVRTGAIAKRAELPEFVTSASLSRNGDRLALVAESRTTLPEVYLGATLGAAPLAVTRKTRRVEGWSLGTRETVSWTAADGLEIEGVLIKPAGFDPGRRHPLLVVVHGGPRALSRPTLFQDGYPTLRWVATGAVVLLPNYRGSAGYGPAFRTAHHRTLGLGDAKDVEAGVDHLVELGFVDPDRIGLMGWSYGGFISAWLTATSDRFAAVSVGAGISDWRTHYAWESANITTRVFSFGTTPWEDPETWAAASPITHIEGARTPTLIQHVVGDPVVSVLSAYELYQALLDLGVETEFVQFPGSGHFPWGPKSQLAIHWQNWEWFARHLGSAEPDREAVVGR